MPAIRITCRMLYWEMVTRPPHLLVPSSDTSLDVVGEPRSRRRQILRLILGQYLSKRPVYERHYPRSTVALRGSKTQRSRNTFYIIGESSGDYRHCVA